MKKYAFMFLFLILVISLTLYNVLNAETLNAFRNCLKTIDYRYIIVLLLIIPTYFFLQALYMKIILGSLKTKISLLKGFFYSMVEFCFSGITPSSTGGQPAQLYYMSKDKIKKSSAAITLLFNTIFFKLIMVIFGILILVFKHEYVFSYSKVYTGLFFLGFTFDIIIVVGCFLLLFHQGILRSILKFFLKILMKIPYLRRKLEHVDVDEKVTSYARQMGYIKKHPQEVFLTFAITLVQRILFFSIAYIVYRGMGYSGVDYFELLAIQITVQLTIEMYPLPGGAVVSETMFRDMFVTIFGIGIAEVGMLFTRLFAFYIPLIISALVIVIMTIIERRRYVE